MDEPNNKQSRDSAPPPTPAWVKALAIVVVLIVVLVAIVVLTGIGGPHGPLRHIPAGS